MIQRDSDTWEMVVLNLRRLEALAEVLWQASYNDPDIPADMVKEVAGVIKELAREAWQPLEALTRKTQSGGPGEKAAQGRKTSHQYSDIIIKFVNFSVIPSKVLISGGK